MHMIRTMLDFSSVSKVCGQEGFIFCRASWWALNSRSVKFLVRKYNLKRHTPVFLHQGGNKSLPLYCFVSLVTFALITFRIEQLDAPIYGITITLIISTKYIKYVFICLYISCHQSSPTMHHCT